MACQACGTPTPEPCDYRDGVAYYECDCGAEGEWHIDESDRRGELFG